MPFFMRHCFAHRGGSGIPNLFHLVKTDPKPFSFDEYMTVRAVSASQGDDALLNLYITENSFNNATRGCWWRETLPYLHAVFKVSAPTTTLKRYCDC